MKLKKSTRRIQQAVESLESRRLMSGTHSAGAWPVWSAETTGFEVGSGIVTATIVFPQTQGSWWALDNDEVATCGMMAAVDPTSIGSGDFELVMPDGARYWGELDGPVAIDEQGAATATFRFAPGAVDHLIGVGEYRIELKADAVLDVDGNALAAATVQTVFVVNNPAAAVTDVIRGEDSLEVKVSFDSLGQGWRSAPQGEPLFCMTTAVDPDSLGDGDLILTLADGTVVSGRFGGPDWTVTCDDEAGGTLDSTSSVSHISFWNSSWSFHFDGITAATDLSGAVLSVVDGSVVLAGATHEIIGTNLDATAFGIGSASVPVELYEEKGELPVEPVPESTPLVGDTGISTETVDGVTLKRGKVKFQVRLTNTSDETIKGPATFSVAVVDAATGETSGDTLILKRRVNLDSGESKVVSYSRKLSREDAEMLATSAKLAIATETPGFGDAASASDELFCDVSVLA